MKARTSVGKTAVGGRKPGLFRIGPGLAVAALLGGYLLFSGRLASLGDRPRLPAESRASHAPAPPFPDVATLIRLEKDLGLTTRQATRLKSLRDEQKRRSAALETALDRRAGEMDDYIKQARSKGGLNVRDLQGQGADYSSLSAAMAKERQHYWNRGVALLTLEQRERLKEVR